MFYNHAINFLRKRGLDDIDIKKYKIGFCDDGVYQNRIIVPSYDENGVLNYFVGRSFMGDNMKYKNPMYHEIYFHLMGFLLGLFQLCCVRVCLMLCR